MRLPMEDSKYFSSDDTDPELVKELIAHGGMIGALFTEEINTLVNKHKEFTLGNDQNVIAITKVIFNRLGVDYLQQMNSIPVHPKLWAEFYMILSRSAELMYTEGVRIRKEFEQRKKK